MWSRASAPERPDAVHRRAIHARHTAPSRAAAHKHLKCAAAWAPPDFWPVLRHGLKRAVGPRSGGPRARLPRDAARATVRPSGNRAANEECDNARLCATRPTVLRHGAGPADGARRCGQPRVLRGRGAQDWYHRDAHFADWALSSPPTCGQKTRRSDSSARVRARRRVRAVSTLGKPGAQMQRRSPQHKPIARAALHLQALVSHARAAPLSPSWRSTP